MQETLRAGSMPVVIDSQDKIRLLRQQGATVVTLCDDSRVFSSQFEMYMAEEPHVFLLSSTSSYETLAKTIGVATPDVVVASFSVLCDQEFLLIRELKMNYSNVKIISARTPADASTARNLFSMNVDAVLGNKAASGEYSVAIRAVGFGGLYVSKEISDVMALTEKTEPVGQPPETAASDPVPSARTTSLVNDYGLSQRELEVLHLVAKGLSSKQIAPIVGISARTVEAHRANIKRKTSAMGLSDLVAISINLAR